MRAWSCLVSALVFVLASCSPDASRTPDDVEMEASPVPDAGFASDVVYHVFQRSFYDSDGDEIGDLAGLTEKLDYLGDLGVTTVLMLPIYPSIFYHNYFAESYQGVDEEYGTLEDYSRLVEALHERGMKLIMDVEMQYVTEPHIWWQSEGHPDSEYSDYILYNGPGNTNPESMVYGLTEMVSYTGEKRRVTTANLLNPEVRDQHLDLMRYWVDPNGDGDFSDGVDGFRLDHMMDDLDGKGILPTLFVDYWTPLFAGLRAVNPDLIFLAEQADWTAYGNSHFEGGGVDAVFAFPLWQAILAGDKVGIEAAVTETLRRTPEGRHQLLFLENHDTDRFASVVESDPARLRSGAALVTLLYGIPSLYYGQEIGMRGRIVQYGMHDGNAIPVREAFEWYADDEGPGMAYWYRDSGPWWDDSLIRPGDGVSVQEQRDDPNSLWNHYAALLDLRSSRSALQEGTTRLVTNDHDAVLTFARIEDGECVLVAVSLGDDEATARLAAAGVPVECAFERMQAVSGWEATGGLADGITLEPGQTAVWETR